MKRYYTKRSISSSLEQSYKNLEVIVVDGGSTDKTIEIIESFNHNNFKKIIGKDTGIYDAWNKALNLFSGGGFVLGGDDYWLKPNCLQLLINKSKNAILFQRK